SLRRWSRGARAISRPRAQGERLDVRGRPAPRHHAQGHADRAAAADDRDDGARSDGINARRARRGVCHPAEQRAHRGLLFVGPISSNFDYTTFFVMLWVFDCWDTARAALFQTGWFVESLMTQTLIIHVIRTNKIPILQSRSSWPMLAMSLVIMAIGIAIPFSPVGSALGFTKLPALYWPLLGVT